MRIDHNNSGNPSLDRTGQVAGADSGSVGAKSGAPRGANTDGLQLSNFAGKLSQVMQNDSADRTGHVARLASAVRSGTYQVDSAAVSRAIVDHLVASGANGQ
ncbi:MAG TPA: flagellar biosynthesis anti-sigma factor FlgM [Bryobacteraceae bacterium]|nr:flagellar biosynthesis anti-sigma factor FlgM [Bryobacteraceae bacterium]